MAECHPVGFQWVVEAKERGAQVVHVDPRFTRTSALSDLHVAIRPGTDIAFLGGVINYILENERWFKEYVLAYTNAATVISEEFADTEDLDGLFSGWGDGTYDVNSWQYEGTDVGPAAGERQESTVSGEQSHGAHGSGMTAGEPPHVDRTLQHPRCVFQLLKKHYRRYTPAMVADTCGVPEDVFTGVCESLCDNSGRERTGAFVYAVGWTQHTTGVQNIRAAAIVQMLLGNIGRPGGGIVALRGHASIQGSTDIPTLYNILPGYLPMPHAVEGQGLDEYIEVNEPDYGFWGNSRDYMVSLLKAWWGDAATEDNDFCFDYLPRIASDHSAYRTALEMIEGNVRGYFVMGENPVVGNANGGLHRRALANVEWLVVRDFSETETAAFWHESPEIETGETRTEDIATEVFFMPAAAHTEKSGSFTNTQRLLQWHHKAVEPKGDCRSELWFMHELGRRVRAKLADSTDPRDFGILELTWDYPTEGEHDDPDAEAVLREISGVKSDGTPLSSYEELESDGSTRCGCWIYCGCYADGVNQTARRKPHTEQSWVAPEWAWAWPANRRILYNRASADPDGKPWSERKKYVWWDADEGKWTGLDVPDFIADRPPDYEPDEDAKGPDAIRGDEPFIMQADGKAWLFAPNGLTDGPFPTHYEPHESPVSNAFYSQDANPTRLGSPDDVDPNNPPQSERFPFAVTTYRLTEHHTAGGMSRTVPYLSELQPELFCEVSPELAELRGLEHRGWATIVTSRAAIEARVHVTERIRPQKVRGSVVHTVGLPYHWGRVGLTTGDSANDLSHIVLDSNVHIQEVKAFTCDIQPGRRPRGKALKEYVEGYRA
jgi:formate dehydrogenase major subunit